MALKHMSGKTPGSLTTAKEVSENFRTPFDATARVMQVMAQRGLLKSEQGAFGGYQIVRDLKRVTLNDLIDIIQGPTTIAKCVHNEQQNTCEIQQNCNIMAPVSNLNERLTDFYKSVTIEDLILRN